MEPKNLLQANQGMNDERSMLRKLFSEERLGKIFAEVFDRYTIDSIHHLAENGYFTQLESLIQTGKEAHVYRAIDNAGHYRAVKIYKIETTDFKNMREYLDGDPRFRRSKPTPRSTLAEWVKKEYKNLSCYRDAGIRVPLPLTFRQNILVMEFIGTNGEPALPIKEKPLANPPKLLEWTADTLARMKYRARIVHADLSEYNILQLDNEPVVIDCGQGVSLTHPRAKAFFERDVKNMAHYLTKQGVRTSPEHLLEIIEARGQTLRNHAGKKNRSPR